MYPPIENNSFENRLRNWIKTELNLKQPNQSTSIIELCNEHKVIGKLFSHCIITGRSRNRAERYIEYRKYSRLINSIEVNNRLFEESRSHVEHQSVEDLKRTQTMQNYRKLFLLLTGSQLYKMLCNYNIQQELDDKKLTEIGKHLHILETFCEKIDKPIQQLIEDDDDEFKTYYENHLKKYDEILDEDLPSFDDISVTIHSTMINIIESLDKILRTKSWMKIKNEEEPVKVKLDKTTQTQSEFTQLQSLIENWISCYHNCQKL
ncbi:hypothetical protein BLOT_005680 [Blomia tropicalis]|nr:hypothetical protein BLOT_005680 [Blomia tropicalis]